MTYKRSRIYLLADYFLSADADVAYFVSIRRLVYASSCSLLQTLLDLQGRRCGRRRRTLASSQASCNPRSPTTALLLSGTWRRRRRKKIQCCCRGADPTATDTMGSIDPVFHMASSLTLGHGSSPDDAQNAGHGASGTQYLEGPSANLASSGYGRP